MACRSLYDLVFVFLFKFLLTILFTGLQSLFPEWPSLVFTSGALHFLFLLLGMFFY